MAARCCSYCDVSFASIVWWPLLCGRGAISLTSTFPSRVTNISTASMPIKLSFSTINLAILSASPKIPGERSAGAKRYSTRFWMGWKTISTAGKLFTSPRSLRATITAISLSKGINFSNSAGASNAFERSSLVRMIWTPLPSYPSRPSLFTAGRKDAFFFTSAAFSTSKKSAVGMLCCW